MTSKKLVSLTAAAAVLAVLAYLSNSGHKMKTPSLVGNPLLPALNLSDVQRIEIGPSGGQKLVLESTDSGWGIKSLFGYPADIAKIREHLLALKDLKIGQMAPGKKLENPTLVDLQDAAGKSLATVRLGDKHNRSSGGDDPYGGGGYADGRYVSAAGSDAAFLVKETLDAFDGDPKSWTDTQIASVPAADITAIRLSNTGGNAVSMEKKAGVWTLDGLGEKEEFDTSKSYGVESALSYLNFASVADPALTEVQLGLASGAVYQATLKNGEVYTATIGGTATNSTDRYVRLSATFTPTGTNATENAELEKKVKAFNEKVGKWTYAVSSYNAENMTKKRADLIKAKEELKKDDAKKDEPEK